MKIRLDIKWIKFYLWVGLAYLALWLFNDLVNFPGTFFTRIFNNTWRTAFVVVINFIFFEYTLPYLQSRKNIITRVLLSILVLWLMLMLYSFGLYAWRYLGISLHIYTSLVVYSSRMQAITYQVTYGVMSLFFFGIARHLYNYTKLKESTQQLRIEKQEAELNYLRSQTNPHFLFNTLNNIYALAKDKSDLAPESILRLSKILRFMLYETGGAYIAIEQEIKIITDYIALEQLRYDETLRINFNHDIEDMKQAVPPLLMIPLVENAFKHGLSETRNLPFLDIHLSLKNRVLTFIVKNSADQFDGSAVKENIGLANLRRQLELLYKDFNLTVQHEKSLFTATLRINLASHV